MSSTSSTDCDNSCVFAFADGRRCTMLPAPTSKYGLCYFHHQQYIDRLNQQHAGEQICRGFADDINTACDLSAAFTNLFRATALGYIKPKTAHTLTYLGNLMLQTHQLAKQEYESAFQNDPWPDVVAGSICFRENKQPGTPPAKPVYPPDPPDSEPDPDPDPGSDRAPDPEFSDSPQPSNETNLRRGAACCAPCPQDHPEEPPARTATLHSLKENLLKMRQILEDVPAIEPLNASLESTPPPENDPKHDPESNEDPDHKSSGGFIPPSCSCTNQPGPAAAAPPQHSQIETPPQPNSPTAASTQAAALLAAHLQHLLRLYYFDKTKRAQS